MKEEGLVMLSSTTSLHAKHRKPQPLHPTPDLGDCLFRSLLLSIHRFLQRVTDSSLGQPKVLPSSDYFTAINNSESLLMFSTQIRWIGFTSKVKQNELEPKKLKI